MKILCVHCNQTYEVESRKKLMEQPSGLALERVGARLRLSWWRHGFPWDLRWLGGILGAVILWLGSRVLPAKRALDTGEAPVWILAGCVISATLLVVVWLFRRFFQRQVVEADPLTLRAWNEPMGMGAASLGARQLQQLYVTKAGELRCQTGPRSHTVLLSGPPHYLRFAEQTLEQHLHVEDSNVEGEWRAPDWILDEWRVCTHCKKTMPTKEFARRADPTPQPAGTYMERRGEGLSLSWHWRTGGQVPFLTLWLLIWDSVCLAIVAPALNQVFLHGNLAALGAFLIPHVWVGALMTYYYITLLANKTVLTCDKDALRIDSGPLPWPSAHREYAARELRQLYITARRSKNSTSYSLDANLTSGERVKLLGNEPHARLLFLEQEIEGYYGICQQ